MDLTKKDLVMTSRELAKLTNKEHKNVIRDIRVEKEKLEYDTTTRYKITQKLNELENKTKLPGTYKEALLALVAAEEIKEQQQLLIATVSENTEEQIVNYIKSQKQK